MTEAIGTIADQIRSRIAIIDAELQAVRELQTERERLSKALQELGGPAGAGSSKKSTSGRHPRPNRRAAPGSNPARIMGALEGSQGMSAAEVRRAAGIDHKTLHSTLSRMVRSGRLERKEAPDGARYVIGKSNERAAARVASRP